MKKFAALSALSLALLLPAVPALAAPVPDASTAQSLRDAVRTDRKSVVLKSLALDEAQTERFVKIYAAYEKELDALHARFTRLVVEKVSAGDKLTERQAKYFSREYLAMADAENKLYRKYHPRVVKAIGETGAARFLSAERRIRALQDYDLWM